MEVTQSHGLTEGKTRVWIITLNTIKGISPDRGENQREKSKVSLLPVSPYYTTLSCDRTHYLVHTDPTLWGPLTNSGCMYASYFTSTVTPEVKVERSSDLRGKWSSDMGVERSSNSKSGAGWSSDLGVGWNLEQRKCEMGCPLKASWMAGSNASTNLVVSCIAFMHFSASGAMVAGKPLEWLCQATYAFSLALLGATVGNLRLEWVPEMLRSQHLIYVCQ